MKTKSILFASILAFGAFISNAQIVEKGDQILNLGIGLGSTIYTGNSYNGMIPPVSASYEYVFFDKLLEGKAAVGVGGYLGYSSFKSKYNGNNGDYGYKYSNIVIGPRGFFHYNFVDNLDTYAGILLGYRISSDVAYGTVQSGIHADNYAGIAWSGFIGGRYFFSDNVAAMAELGYGIAYLNLGITFKF